MWLLWAVRLLASEPRTGPSSGVFGLGSCTLPQWSARPSGHRAKCTWKSELPQGCYMALMHRAVTSRRMPYRPFIGTRSLGNHPVLQRSVWGDLGTTPYSSWLPAGSVSAEYKQSSVSQDDLHRLGSPYLSPLACRAVQAQHTCRSSRRYDTDAGPGRRQQFRLSPGQN